jgi:hypothetical protein
LELIHEFAQSLLLDCCEEIVGENFDRLHEWLIANG